VTGRALVEAPSASRPWTADEDHPDGRRTIHLKRACNGCGALIGDVTDDEMDAAVDGRPLPDVTGECPVCTPWTGSTALVGPVRWVPGVPAGLTERDADDLMRRIAATVWPLDLSPIEGAAHAQGWDARESYDRWLRGGRGLLRPVDRCSR
jgi:hypothetical protein